MRNPVTRRPRRTSTALLALPLAAVLALGTACGGGDDEGSSDDGPGSAGTGAAAKESFCTVWQEDTSDVKDGESLREYAQEIEDTGIPDEAPADAKDGYQLLVKALLDVPGDLSATELKEYKSPDFSEADKTKVGAFREYLTDQCLATSTPAPSGGASDAPSGSASPSAG